MQIRTLTKNLHKSRLSLTKRSSWQRLLVPQQQTVLDNEPRLWQWKALDTESCYMHVGTLNIRLSEGGLAHKVYDPAHVKVWGKSTEPH